MADEVKNAAGKVLQPPTIGHKLLAFFSPGSNLLVIKGTLEPPTEGAHEQLAALLEHKTRNIAEYGAAELKLRHQARDKGIPLAAHKASVKAESDAKKKADADAKKKDKKENRKDAADEVPARKAN